jgi:hypothetical protein
LVELITITIDINVREKNRQSRYTGNIGYTKNRRNANTTQKTKRINNTDPITNTGARVFINNKQLQNNEGKSITETKQHKQKHENGKRRGMAMQTS